MQTFSEENYLKVIYNLETQGADKISLTAIADVLHNNPASVTDMLKKLSDKKLLQYEKKKGVKLTDKGRKAAMLVVRKHRLWEVFLFEKLGFAWDEVHDIAEQLEHAQHDELADRLDEYLGFPKYDPHGDPVPQANGALAKMYKTTLAEMTDKKTCQVVGVKDASTAFLQYLQKLSVGIGTKIKVVEKIPFDESMVIIIGSDPQMTVSKKFSESILVI